MFIIISTWRIHGGYPQPAPGKIYNQNDLMNFKHLVNMTEKKLLITKVERSDCWLKHPLKEVVAKSCREKAECGHVDNARKKNTSVMNLKHLVNTFNNKREKLVFF